MRVGRAPALLVAALSTMVLIAAPALAQEAAEEELAPVELRIESADVTNHPEVTLTVSVPRVLVEGELDERSFTVHEAGIPRPVSVEAVPSDDLQVILVLDTSGSMLGEPLAAAKVSALNFVAEMPQGVDIAVVAFGSEPELVTEFTEDTAVVEGAIRSLDAGGETALYDALLASSELFQPDDPARRAVILLSDGGDTVSVNALESALIGLLDAEVSFHAVELQSPESDSQALMRMAVATKGTVVSAADPAALNGLFGEIAAQLVNQYHLTFQSAAFGTTPVEVTVGSGEVTGTAGVSLRLPPPPPSPTPVTPRPAPQPAVPVPTTLAPLRDGTVVTVGFLGSDTALYLGSGLVFLALLAMFVLVGPREREGRSRRALGELLPQRASSSTGGAIAGIAAKATEFAETRLRSTTKAGAINRKLEQAGVLMRPAEFVVLSASFALGGLALGLVLRGPLLGLIFAAVTLLGIRLWLSNKAEKRKAAFAEQLGDTLQLMAGSLRAGYGLLQAIDAVAAEAPSPTSDEFQRLKVETHLGRDIDESLRAMARRVDSEDFEWVAEAIQIHREVGGDLGEILDAVTGTIRARTRLRRRIRSLSAEGRISAVILSALPFVVGSIIAITNPEYLAELTTSGVGQFMIVAGVVGMVVGSSWMRKIIRIDF